MPAVTPCVWELGAATPLSPGLQKRWVCNALKDEPANPLKLNYNVAASFQEPFLLSRHNRGTVSLSAEQHSEIQAYIRQAISANVGVTRQTRWNIPGTASYATSRGRTLAEPATFCAYLNVCDSSDVARFQQWQVESVLGVSLVRDRSNSVIDPTRGSRLSAEARYAAGFLGSDSLNRFARGVAELASYHQLGRRTVFAWRIEGGAIVSPQLGFAGQSVRFVPPSERFYAGGPNSVRGYGQNQLGPVVRVVDPTRGDTVIRPDSVDSALRDTVFVPDTLRDATGGNSLLLATAELRFPLPGFSGGPSAARGAGSGMTTAVAPVRCDVALKGYGQEQGRLNERQGQNLVLVQRVYPTVRMAAPHLQFHFAIGQAF